MKRAMVVYYSCSGNTKKTAEFLKDKITRKFQTEVLELKPADESRFFLSQCVRAFRKVKAKFTQDMITDLKDYDLIAFGTPVWAFGMAPAMRAYLDKCSGLAGKKIILFSTYGSGVGKDKCLQEMATVVKAKGADEVRSFLIPHYDVKNSDVFSQKTNGLI